METLNNKTQETITKEEFLSARNAFRKALKDPKAKPRYCKTYGTKYPGNIEFLHFGFYAILRNADIRKITHDVDSENYKRMVGILKSGWQNSSITSIFEGLTAGQVSEVIANYEKW